MATGEAGGLCTRRELAAAFDVDMQTITKWERGGLPIHERGTPGRPSVYRLKDCIDWFVARELRSRGVTAGDADGVKLSPVETLAALNMKRTEDLDLKIRVRKGELIEVEEAARDMANVAIATKARLRRVPDAIADQLVTACKADPKYAPALRKRLLVAIDDALRELAAHGEPADEGVA